MPGAQIIPQETIAVFPTDKRPHCAKAIAINGKRCEYIEGLEVVIESNIPCYYLKGEIPAWAKRLCLVADIEINAPCPFK